MRYGSLVETVGKIGFKERVAAPFVNHHIAGAGRHFRANGPTGASDRQSVALVAIVLNHHDWRAGAARLILKTLKSSDGLIQSGVD
jgi:hypothetical protein